MARAFVEGRKTVTRRLDRRLLSAQPGDLLLGKEAFAVDRIYDQVAPSKLPGNPEVVHYMADGGKPAHVGKTRVSIHMPDWACRIRTRIVSVREEPLWDITAVDVAAEGIDPGPHRCGNQGCGQGALHCPAIESSITAEFADLWDSIHGTGSWSTNPTIVRVEFKPEARA
jgi:hypothetical protein